MTEVEDILLVELRALREEVGRLRTEFAAMQTQLAQVKLITEEVEEVKQEVQRINVMAAKMKGAFAVVLMLGGGLGWLVNFAHSVLTGRH